MIRKYGKEPYHVAVIHGGPGALGSLGCVAKELSKTIGVIEPIQSKYTVSELIDELHRQLHLFSHGPMALVGHSWGAWLSVLYAAKYHGMVKKLILIGCPPFESRYVSQIMERRLQKLSPEKQIMFQDLLSKFGTETNKDDLILQLEQFVAKTDNYDIEAFSENEIDSLSVDGEMHTSIWNEAAEMRQNGELLKTLEKISCPVMILHGDNDPHPIDGVTEPLTACHVKYDQVILPFCGHSPFKEKRVHEQFYEILLSNIMK